MDPAAAGPAGHDHDVDLVVIGGSAGSLSVLTDLVGLLPPAVGAAIAVVLHIPATSRSRLRLILQRHTVMPVGPAVDGRQMRRGEILVARPDRHLMIDGPRVVLSRAAKVNGHRPAIDPLFESASRSFGPRVLGIVLSGMLDDGVAGLGAIRAAGGVTAVQDPAGALHPDMPAAAIQAGVAGEVLPVAGLADLVESTASRGSGPLVASRGGGEDEGERSSPDGMPETPSVLTCPNCSGPLMEVTNGGVEQYACRVGHRYSAASLYEVQGGMLDEALWAAHRALRERADLARRIARRMRRADLTGVADQHVRTAEEADRNAAVVLRALTGPGTARSIGDDTDDGLDDDMDGSARAPR